MSLKNLEETVELLQEIEEYRNTHKLEFYKPYDFQSRFHLAQGRGEFVPVKSDSQKQGLAILRFLMCANQIGKCATATSLVYTSKGRKKFKDIWGKGNISVLTYPDMSPRKVTKWIRKRSEECFRITMSDGQWFECPKGHLILTTDGFSFLGDILESLPESVYARLDRPLHHGLFSRVLRYLLNAGINVPHLFGTIRGYLDRYLTDPHLCGGQLLYDREGVQVFSPLPNDARQHIGHLYNVDGPASRCIGILYGWLYRLSSRCVVPLTLGQSASFGGQVVLASYPEFGGESLEPLQSSCWGHQENEASSSDLHQSIIFSSADSVMAVNGTRIESVYSVGVHTLYDMEVEERHNYVAGGLIHHNSTAGGFETAIHLTGKYPSWWKGHRFNHPVEWMCSSNTNETTRDRCQRELFGDPADRTSMGTGAVPKEDIGDTTRKAGVPDAIEVGLVKHYTNDVFDGWSKTYLKSYDQGQKKFQGYRLHGFWDDEEPPRDILSQQQRSTLATDGIGYITYTPEEGVTEVVHEILHDPKPGWSLIQATWDDAPHMTPDKRHQKLMQYPPHERDMRSRGIPMIGTGLVWPVEQSQILCDPFEIPFYFRRICGIDFGWDHPFGALWIAKDNDKDILYIYDVFKQSKAVIPVLASAIKSRGDWIPVVWPHDGMKHDPKSGKPMADLFRHEGINMWREPFSNPPSPGQKEGQGGNGVEIGVIDILTRMETGRFKVFSHLKEWWDEWRMYHRKNGEIVKLNDDLMSATRYASMMIRHAQTKPVAARKQQTYSSLRNW